MSRTNRKRITDVRQRDIFFAHIPESVGSVQKGTRPVVITQNNRLNRHSTTFVCALVTSQIKRCDLEEHVVLPYIPGLPKHSMVMAEQRLTIDRKQLIEHVGYVDAKTFRKIMRACRHCEKPVKRRKM